MNKIVIVEDDLAMRSLLETLFEMEGFQVINFRDEVKNITSILKAEKPALALIDVNLRRASGLDLLKNIRNDPELGDVRVIMSSGMNYSAECREAGADNFILKPYMPDQLIKMIRQIIPG
jgi:DNA-binding response OmpR family regulator